MLVSHTHIPLHTLLVRTLGATHNFRHPWTGAQERHFPAQNSDISAGRSDLEALFCSSNFQKLPQHL